MNVLFVQSILDVQSETKPLPTTSQMQCGISYISSLLRKHGHATRLFILSRAFSKKSNYKRIDGYLKKFHPRMICFTIISCEYRFIADIASCIKSSYPDIFLLAGGPHVSLNPDDVIAASFDAVCIGEGEYPTLELASQLEKGASPSGIPNLWIKRGSLIEKNQPRPFLRDLNSLPFPDRDMWQEWIEQPMGERFIVLAGRGCPFECTYCCNHALKRLADGPYVRFRSPDNIIEEIKEISSIFPTVKEIFLEVETIGVNLGWTLDLCSKLERLNMAREKPLYFGTNLRIMPYADLNSLFGALKKSNFKFINIGLESGSERVRREILNRHYSNRDIIDAVRLAKEHGLKIALFNMLGIPGETLDDFMETIEVNRACLPDMHFTAIFYPYPGTKLYSLCKEKGLLREIRDPGFVERRNAPLDLPGFSKRQIQKSYIWFNYNVYRGNQPIYKLLAHVLRAELERKSYLNYLYRSITRLGIFKGLKKSLEIYKTSFQPDTI